LLLSKKEKKAIEVEKKETTEKEAENEKLAAYQGTMGSGAVDAAALGRITMHICAFPPKLHLCTSISTAVEFAINGCRRLKFGRVENNSAPVGGGYVSRSLTTDYST